MLRCFGLFKSTNSWASMTKYFIQFFITGLAISVFLFDVSISNIQAEQAILEPRSFDENMRSDIPVSGNFLKGILATDVNTNIDPNNLFVWLPSSSRKLLCLTVDSRDGIYHAKVEYDIAGKPEGFFRLKIPTKHKSNLQGYKARELAILPHISSTCGDSPGEIVPIFWGGVPMTVDQIILLTNSRNADVRYSVDFKEYSGCSPINELPRTAFDTECEIEVPASKKQISIILVLDDFESRIGEIRFTLHKP